MASPFDALAALADASVDASFAESLRIDAFRPAMRGSTPDPNLPPVADDTRPAFETRGVFFRAATTERSDGRGKSGDAVLHQTSPRPRVDCPAPPWQLRRLDRVTVIDTGEVFTVEEFKMRDFGRVLIELTRTEPAAD